MMQLSSKVLYSQSLYLHFASTGILYCAIRHPSFVTMAPHLQGGLGDSRAKVRGKYFLIVPTEQEKLQGFDIRILTRGDFL